MEDESILQNSTIKNKTKELIEKEGKTDYLSSVIKKKDERTS